MRWQEVSPKANFTTEIVPDDAYFLIEMFREPERVGEMVRAGGADVCWDPPKQAEDVEGLARRQVIKKRVKLRAVSCAKVNRVKTRHYRPSRHMLIQL